MKSLSHVRPPVTSWTAAYQAPPSMGFSRQEYWSGLPLPSPLSSERTQVTNDGQDVEKGNPCTLLVGIKIGAATVENSMEISQKTKNRTTMYVSCSVMSDSLRPHGL